MLRYTIEDVPDYFQPVLQRIADLFARDAVVDRYDDEWVHFHLPGLTDGYAILKLETEHDAVLPGADLPDFQILCSWAAAKGRGLWLHYLPASEAPDDYLSGVWFY